MAKRTSTKKSGHDAAIAAAANILRDKGKHVWTNPGSDKNKSWAGKYIDVIAADRKDDKTAHVIEIETADSVSDSEARDQWADYAKAYSAWLLAVPVESKQEAKRLLKKHGITRCTIITWKKNKDGGHTFWGLPK